MTDKERIDDAYERIDIDTDEILAFYDGERVERCLKSIWDSTVTMHQIATVALKENAKLREVIDDITEVVEVSDPALVEFIAKRMQRVRIEVR